MDALISYSGSVCRLLGVVWNHTQYGTETKSRPIGMDIVVSIHIANWGMDYSAVGRKKE